GAITLSWPDRRQPDTLGWKIWFWDNAQGLLISPWRATPWHFPELRAESFSDGSILRNKEGIHACRMPYDWLNAPLDTSELGDYEGSGLFTTVIGVVERFGKFVLGTKGWRAEIAVIKKLRAPNTELGLKLEAKYPDVEVYYL